MLSELKSLFEGLKGLSPKAKGVAVLALLATAVVVSAGGIVASKPHFTLLYSDLDDIQNAAVQKALAEAAVRYRASQPPAPFAIHVDESEYYEAQNAVARTSALDRVPSGITSNRDGASTVFMSAGERAQNALKREWQELEHQLEALEFVSQASVTTSIPDTSPLHKDRSMTASVILHLRGEIDLSHEQQRAIATLVRFRFNIPSSNLIVSDHLGRTLFDPLSSSQDGNPESLLGNAISYDRELAAKANTALVRAFGPNNTHVTVTSEWDYARSTSIVETPSKGVEVSKEETKTKTPQGGAGSGGGAAGISANVPNASFGVDNAGLSAPAGGNVATSEDKRTVYEAGRSTQHVVQTMPQLRQLSVSLFIDEGLADRQQELEEIVKASVGFVESKDRTDNLRSIVTPLAQVQADLDTTEEEPESAVPAGPNPMLEMILENGVEIIAALAFLFLLKKSLKGPGKPSLAVGGDSAVDVERLVQAQVEELVRSEPERVGEILSQWAREDGVPSEATK